MASVHSYMSTMQGLMQEIGLTSGTDLSSMSKTNRVASTAEIAMVAVVIKCLVDNGRLTDAQLAATVAAARAEPWPDIDGS